MSNPNLVWQKLAFSKLMVNLMVNWPVQLLEILKKQKSNAVVWLSFRKLKVKCS